jgi:predicted tellurium resistance membrane protein TerC
MNILNILTSHTTPLQTFGLSLYIGGIMAMIFIERELYISLSKIYGAMFVFMIGITIFSFDMDKADINMKTAIIMTVIGIVAMITPLAVEVLIKKIKDRKKGSE